MIPVDKPGSPHDLVLLHYGKKGMKWGIRKAHQIKVSERAARSRRVAEGKGSKLDVARVAARTSGYDLVKGRGFKGAALNSAKREEQHIQRITSGRSTVRDILKESGGILFLNIRDLSKVRKAA